MGQLTTNRKRGGDSIRYTSTSPYFNPFNNIDSSSLDLPISKKPKTISSSMQTESLASSVSSNQSTLLRLRQYPEPVKPLLNVHAPCRNPRFSNSRIMGSWFSRLQDAKTAAVNTFRFRDESKSKKAADVDVDVDINLVSDDSIVEEEEEEVIVWSSKRGSEKKKVELLQKSVETEDDAFLKEKYRSFESNDVQVSSSVVTDLSTPEADKGRKMLGFVSEDHVVQEVGESPYKKLYDSAQRRDSKLSHFTYQIAYLTKKLSNIWRMVKKPEKVEEIQDPREETLVPLTDEEEAEVSQALSNSKRRKLLVTHADSNIEITGEVLQCLKPRTWLNDEVINLYLELLKEREKREPKRFLKCHFFNTFFYKKLISGKGGYDFKSVRRWTTQRKIGYGLVECDKIFVPIHKEIHWCLAIINIKDQKFQYLDSLKGRDSKVLQVLARYYVDEVKDKSAKDINVDSWKREYVSDLPAQENGYDCGMFMIKYADFYSRGLGLCFGQENMPYFRRRTAKEILRLKAE